MYRLLHEALLSALIVPASSVNDKNKSNSGNPATANNKYFTHSLFQLANDYFGVGRRRQIKPSQQALLHEIMAEVRSIRPSADRQRPSERTEAEESPEDGGKGRGGNKEGDPMRNAKDLHRLLAANTFNPLTFTASLSTVVGRLEADNGVKVEMYRAKVHEKGVTMLLKQLSVCYKAISWDRLSELTFPKNELSDIELERIITNSVYYDSTGCTISHSQRLISFHDNNLESDILSDSIVELNRSLMDIKRTKNLYVPDPVQRQNVYDTIRNQVAAEHKRIDYRLIQIQRQRVLEANAKAEQRRLEMEKVAKARSEREAAKRKELEKVAESKKEIEQKQSAEKEKKERVREEKMKWSKVLDILKPTASTKKLKQKKGTNTNKQQQISALDNRQKVLQNEIDRQFKEGIDEDAIERNMEKMLYIENRKKRKMLQIERTEFDHFIRAQRRYVQRQIQEEMDRLDQLNVDQRKRLFKEVNRRKKEQHHGLVERKERVRELQDKHLKAFKRIVRDEGRRKQQANAASKQQKQQQPQSKKPKKSQRQKPKQQSNTKSPSPASSLSPQRSKTKPKSSSSSTSSPSPKPSKYVPPRRELPRDPRVGSNGVRSNKAPPQKMTFAMKMQARRANGGVEAASFGRESFSGRFSRNSGAMNGGGGDGEERRRFHDHDNNGSGQMIRPRGNQ